MTPLVPIVPLVVAGIVAWRLMSRAYQPARPSKRTGRRSPAKRARAPAPARKKANGA